jgi:hypothetical protein
LVEQDPHETAAPMNSLLQNRDHDTQQLPVTVVTGVTDFVPEPDSADRRQDGNEWRSRCLGESA